MSIMTSFCTLQFTGRAFDFEEKTGKVHMHKVITAIAAILISIALPALAQRVETEYVIFTNTVMFSNNVNRVLLITNGTLTFISGSTTSRISNGQMMGDWMFSNNANRVLIITNGTLTFVSGSDTNSIGNGHLTGAWSQGEGSKAYSESSHAEGEYTSASNTGAHAEGYSTKALGLYSHAEGYDTIAGGDYSHAEGKLTQALGFGSHAEGEYASTFNLGAHAEGWYTKAFGIYSHAEGGWSVASNAYTHAAGFRAMATNDYSYVWADYGGDTEYGSHGENTYNVRAAGGIWHGDTLMSSNGQLFATNGLYLRGNESTDGSWRIKWDSGGNLRLEYRTGGSWGAKHTWSP